MWLALAFMSAFFAGVTSVLAKLGVKDMDSNLATALRTVVVFVFAWAMVFITNAYTPLRDVEARNLLFLTLSGLATGVSWLCYFKALQLGGINKVVPVDKSSVVLTVLLASALLREGLGLYKLLCVALIGAGTYMMIEKKDVTEAEGKGWFIYAALSAVFASLTAILGKTGVTGMDANLGTAVRTGVVLVMAWLVVFVRKGPRSVKHIGGGNWLFLVLSGCATGASWICFYHALQAGPAGVVVPVDKLSILVTVFCGAVIFKEKLKLKSLSGLALIVAGTIWMIFV